jgi:hypothetical protein
MILIYMPINMFNSEISEIIKSLKNPDIYIMCDAIEKLKTIENEEVMPELIEALQDEEIVSSDSGNNLLFVLQALTKMQRRCKFYNYEIFHSSPIEDEIENKPQATTNNFYAPVGIINTADVNINRDQIGLQDGK